MLCFCQRYLSVAFFLGQSFYGIGMMTIKMGMAIKETEYSTEANALLVWLWGSIFVFLAAVVNLKTTPFIEEIEISMGESKREGKSIDFNAAFQTSKIYLFQIMMLVTSTSIIYPGIVLGLTPLTIMSSRTFMNSINFWMAIFIILGRLSSSFDFNKLLSKVHIVNGWFIVTVFLLYYYYELRF